MDISELLAFSVKNNASDLHLSSGLPPMIRVHGDVRRINLPPLEHKDVHGMIYDIMNDGQRKAYEEMLECDFSFAIPGLARFRVNAYNQERGAAAVLRTIPSKILSLEELNAILVVELRDLETIRLALSAAETGHLVFGTLHTSSAAKTIDRIIDVFPAEEKEMVRAMLSESLQAVISQTLLKTKDGSGRVAAHEIMIGTSAIRNLIREAKVAQMYSAIQTGNSFGMQTLDQNLTELVKRNVISPYEARAKAKIPEHFPG